MAKHIDYFCSLMSPWTYLGAARIEALAKKHGATMTIYPVDFGVIFAQSGGLPLPKRAPQRQAYRLMELARWKEHVGVPLNIHPKFFPGNELPAAKCVIALRLAGRGADAIKLAHAVLKGVWAEDKDVSDPATLAGVIDGCGLDSKAIMAASEAAEVAEARAGDTKMAAERNVFGAPTYVIDGELFWGQDRLDFVDRKLAKA